MNKTNPLIGAMKHIHKICANLDCTLHMVQEHRDELQQFIKQKVNGMMTYTSSVAKHKKWWHVIIFVPDIAEKSLYQN